MTTEEIEDKEFPAAIPLIWLGITAPMFWMIMPFLVGAFVDVLGYSEALAGKITSVQLMSTAAACAVATLTVHRWNLPRIALAGCIIAVLSDFSTGFVQSPLLMTVTRIISGSTMGIMLSTSYAAIAKLKNPTRTLAIVQAGVSGCSIGFYSFFPYLLKTTGLKGPFTGLAAFALVAAILTHIWFPRDKSEGDVAVDQPNLWPILFAAPMLLALIGLFLGPQLAGSMLWPYLERIGVYGGLSLENVGTTFSVSTISGMLGGILAAWMAGKISRALAVTTSGLIVTASWVLFLLYTFAAYFAAMQVFMFAYFVLLAFLLGMFADADPSGRLLAVANVVLPAGGAAGPAVASLFLTGGSYTLMIIVATLISLVSVGMMIPAARKQY